MELEVILEECFLVLMILAPLLRQWNTRSKKASFMADDNQSKVAFMNFMTAPTKENKALLTLRLRNTEIIGYRIKHSAMQK